MDASRDYYTKSERERQIPCNIICMWNLKYDTSALIYKTERDSQTDLWLPKGRKGEGGVGWESGVRCKVLHTEWTNNKVLLYCIGDYVQYPGIL